MPRSMEPARKQIMRAAGDAFYREGIRAVGVDTIAERSGVAKMTLYRHFPSKDDLVVAYLEQSDVVFWTWVESETAEEADPREQLLKLYRAVGKVAAGPDCHGCAFNMSAGEFPEHDHPVHRAGLANKQRLREWLRTKCRAAGATDAASLADQLFLLMDGAWSARRMFGPKNPAAHVAEAAKTLIESAVPAPAKRRSRK